MNETGIEAKEETNSIPSYVLRFHYDLYFAPHPKEQREDLTKSLYNQVKDFFGGLMQLKFLDSSLSIMGESQGLKLHISVAEVVHFVVQFEIQPSDNLLKQLDEFSGKIITFAMSLPGIKIEEIEVGLYVDYKLKTDISGKFIVPTAVAEFSSQMKATTTPFFVSFIATIQEMEVGISIGKTPDAAFLSLTFDNDLKEPPWDSITKYSQKINSIGETILSALGAEVASG